MPGFQSFSGILHDFVLAELDTSGIRVKGNILITNSKKSIRDMMVVDVSIH